MRDKTFHGVAGMAAFCSLIALGTASASSERLAEVVDSATGGAATFEQVFDTDAHVPGLTPVVMSSADNPDKSTVGWVNEEQGYVFIRNSILHKGENPGMDALAQFHMDEQGADAMAQPVSQNRPSEPEPMPNRPPPAQVEAEPRAHAQAQQGRRHEGSAPSQPQQQGSASLSLSGDCGADMSNIDSFRSGNPSREGGQFQQGQSDRVGQRPDFERAESQSVEAERSPQLETRPAPSERPQGGDSSAGDPFGFGQSDSEGQADVQQPQNGNFGHELADYLGFQDVNEIRLAGNVSDEDFSTWLERLPSVTLIDGDGPTVNVFADPHCPHSRSYYQVLGEYRDVFEQAGVRVEMYPVMLLRHGEEAAQVGASMYDAPNLNEIFINRNLASSTDEQRLHAVLSTTELLSEAFIDAQLGSPMTTIEHNGEVFGFAGSMNGEGIQQFVEMIAR